MDQYKNLPEGWLPWDGDIPVPPAGTVIRLMFVNKVVTNPITISDGRGLAWGKHQYYSWRPDAYKMNGFRISAYQILEGK